MEMTMRPMTEMEQMYCYSQSQQLMATTGCIGHLRGDLDSTGEQFYSSWDDHQAQHKTQEFKDEFDAVIHALRTDRNLGALLESRTTLSNYCWTHPEAKILPGYDDYGFRLDTADYAYMLRFNPKPGMYNIYCYCYKREWLDHHLQQAAKGIRFIDSHYNEKFRIADGEKIRIITPGGDYRDMRVRYIDDYHIETQADWGNTLYHICEFAERFEARGCQDIFPLRSNLPDRCYSILESTGDIIIIAKGEKGYYHIEVTENTSEENRRFVDSQNAKMGITRSQEEAMKAGSMFGWATPAADPKNYDDKGTPIPPTRKDRGDAR